MNDVSSTLVDCSKKQMACRLLILESNHWFDQKTRFLFFYQKNPFESIFNPKHLGNTIWTLLNQCMTSKNTKNQSKTQNQPETINLSELISVFLGVLKVKKTSNRNLLYHMKPFDTKINCFGGLNFSQRQLSLSMP